MRVKPSDSVGAVGEVTRPLGEVVEVPLLLPGWQAAALEEAAHRRGLTAGQLARQLIRAFLLQSARAG